jgi:hypothetical protein
MNLAPIVLFVYNRPAETRQTLEALAENHLADESVLYVFADGPKEDASPEQCKSIDEVRALVQSRRWCKEVILYESKRNNGLANSVIRGVTEIAGRHGKIIVLEDDIITSPFFLTYLNEGLEVYKDARHVYAINGYMFPIETQRIDTFLSPLATSTWGWATWADRWKAFETEPSAVQIIQSNHFLRSRFNVGDYNYADMLNNRNSWGIRWYYSVFRRNGLGLFPTRSLCYNIGFGENATHTKTEMAQSAIYKDALSVELKDAIDLEMQAKLFDHFTARKIETPKPTFASFVMRFKKKLYKKLKYAKKGD